MEGCDEGVRHWEHRIKVANNHGAGQVSTGTRDWTDYRIEATVASQLSDSFGIAIRNQGLRQYYAVTVDRDGYVRLLRRYGDHEVALQSVPFQYEWGTEIAVSLQANGQEISATVGDIQLSAIDHSLLTSGGAAIIVTKGHAWAKQLAIVPAGL